MSAAEAAQAARIEAGVAGLTELAIIFALPVVGIILGFTMRRKDQGERFRILPFAICAGLAIVSLFGMVSKRENPVKSAANAKAATAAESDIYESSKNAPAGAIVAPNSPAKAHQAEEAVKVEIEDALRKSGHPSNTVVVKVFEVYANDQVIARVTASAEDGIVEERAEGIVNGKYMKILCDPKDPPTFAFAGSPCEARMEQVFGQFGPSTKDVLANG